MPDITTANDAVVSEKGAIEHLDTKNDNDVPEHAPYVDVHDEKHAEFATDLNNVAQLGFHNAAELEKKVVRALDTWMMPQLWILYMFNYLNRYGALSDRQHGDPNLGFPQYSLTSILTEPTLLKPVSTASTKISTLAKAIIRPLLPS